MMSIQTTSQGDIQVLQLSGHMTGDPAHATQLREAVDEGLEAGSGAFLMGLADVDWINSSGLGQILGIYQVIQRSGAKLAIAGASSRVGPVLRTTRFDKVIPTFASVDEAIASLSKVKLTPLAFHPHQMELAPPACV